MANLQRRRRVEEQILRELSLLIKQELKDPRVGLVTLTAVEVSPDLAHARVLFTDMGDERSRAESTDGLNRAASFLRFLLGQRVRLHQTPALRFLYDDSVEHGMRLTHLIDRAVGIIGTRDLRTKNNDSE